jgi:hypothetical protein
MRYDKLKIILTNNNILKYTSYELLSNSKQEKHPSVKGENTDKF